MRSDPFEASSPYKWLGLLAYGGMSVAATLTSLRRLRATALRKPRFDKFKKCAPQTLISAAEFSQVANKFIDLQALNMVEDLVHFLLFGLCLFGGLIAEFWNATAAIGGAWLASLGLAIVSAGVSTLLRFIFYSASQGTTDEGQSNQKIPLGDYLRGCAIFFGLELIWTLILSIVVVAASYCGSILCLAATWVFWRYRTPIYQKATTMLFAIIKAEIQQNQDTSIFLVENWTFLKKAHLIRLLLRGREAVVDQQLVKQVGLEVLGPWSTTQISPNGHPKSDLFLWVGAAVGMCLGGWLAKCDDFYWHFGFDFVSFGTLIWALGMYLRPLLAISEQILSWEQNKHPPSQPPHPELSKTLLQFLKKASPEQLLNFDSMTNTIGASAKEGAFWPLEEAVRVTAEGAANEPPKLSH